MPKNIPIVHKIIISLWSYSVVNSKYSEIQRQKIQKTTNKSTKQKPRLSIKYTIIWHTLPFSVSFFFIFGLQNVYKDIIEIQNVCTSKICFTPDIFFICSVFSYSCNHFHFCICMILILFSFMHITHIRCVFTMNIIAVVCAQCILFLSNFMFYYIGSIVESNLSTIM